MLAALPHPLLGSERAHYSSAGHTAMGSPACPYVRSCASPPPAAHTYRSVSPWPLAWPRPSNFQPLPPLGPHLSAPFMPHKPLVAFICLLTAALPKDPTHPKYTQRPSHEKGDPHSSLPIHLFHGFPLACKPRLPVDHDAIDPLLQHIHKVLASKESNVNDYILNWLAHIIQNPEKKIGTALVFRSSQGAASDIA